MIHKFRVGDLFLGKAQDLFNIDVLGDGKGKERVKDIYGKDQN